MRTAGGAADAFVHQCAAQIIGAAVQARRRALGPQLGPARLDVAHVRVQHQPRNRVHQPHFAPAWTSAGAALHCQRRFHVDERQRHELAHHAGPRGQIAHREHVRGPVRGRLDVAEHDRGGGGQTDAVCGLDHLQPLRRGQFVGADHRADIVAKDFRCRARQRAKPCVLQPGQECRQRQPQRFCAVPHFERRERVHVDARRGGFRGAKDREVRLAGIGRVDAALEAHLAGPARSGFRHAAGDFGVIKIVGRPAQRCVAPALRECAEPAGVSADVGVIHVAVDDVADRVSRHPPSQRIGGRADAFDIGTTRGE